MARAFDAKRFAINWVRGSGAPECISSSQLARQVEQTLGPVFVAPTDAELFIEAMIDRDGDDFVAHVAVTDRHGRVLGQRELRGEGPDCRKLDVQLVFVIIMTIDPEVALDGLPPELMGQLDGPADPAADLLAQLRAEARVEPADSHTKADRQVDAKNGERPSSQTHRGQARDETVLAARSWRFTASGGAALGGWVMPGVSIGPYVGLAAVAPHSWSIELSAIWWPTQTVNEDEQPGPVDITALRSDLGLCLPVWDPGVMLSGCGALTVTYLFTSTRGDLIDKNATKLQFGPTLEGRIELPVWDWLAARTGVAVHVPVNPERFVLDLGLAEQTVFEPGLVGLSGHLELVWTP